MSISRQHSFDNIHQLCQHLKVNREPHIYLQDMIATFASILEIRSAQAHQPEAPNQYAGN